MNHAAKGPGKDPTKSRKASRSGGSQPPPQPRKRGARGAEKRHKINQSLRDSAAREAPSVDELLAGHPVAAAVIKQKSKMQLLLEEMDNCQVDLARYLSNHKPNGVDDFDQLRDLVELQARLNDESHYEFYKSLLYLSKDIEGVSDEDLLYYEVVDAPNDIRNSHRSGPNEKQIIICIILCYMMYVLDRVLDDCYLINTGISVEYCFRVSFNRHYLFGTNINENYGRNFPWVTIQTDEEYFVRGFMILLFVLLMLYICWPRYVSQKHLLVHHLKFVPAPAEISSAKRNVVFRASPALEYADPRTVEHRVKVFLQKDVDHCGRLSFDDFDPDPAWFRDITIYAWNDEFEAGEYYPAARIRKAYPDAAPNVDGGIVDLTLLRWLCSMPRISDVSRPFNNVRDFVRTSVAVGGHIYGDFSSEIAQSVFSTSSVITLMRWLKTARRSAGHLTTPSEPVDWSL